MKKLLFTMFYATVVLAGMGGFMSGSETYAACPIEDPGNPASYDCHVPACTTFTNGLDLNEIPRPSGGTYYYGSNSMYVTEEMNTSAYLCNGSYFDLGYQNGIVSVNNGIATWTCETSSSPSSVSSVSCSAPVSNTSTYSWDISAWGACSSTGGGTCSGTSNEPNPRKVWINNTPFEWQSNTVYNSSMQVVAGSSVGPNSFSSSTSNGGSCTAASAGQVHYAVNCGNGTTAGSTYYCEWYKAQCNGSNYVKAPDTGNCWANAWCGDNASSTDAITATEAYQTRNDLACPDSGVGLHAIYRMGSSWVADIYQPSYQSQVAVTYIPSSNGRSFITNDNRRLDLPLNLYYNVSADQIREITTESQTYYASLMLKHSCQNTYTATQCSTLTTQSQCGAIGCTRNNSSTTSIQTRTVVCRDNNGNQVSDSLCSQPKPATTQPCGGTATAGTCGSANGGSFPSAPSANLCSSGTTSAVSGTGPWSWQCLGTNGGATASCSATRSTTPVNAVCGTSHGQATSAFPTAGLCSVGIPFITSVSPDGSNFFTWTCLGSDGGATASCNAPYVAMACVPYDPSPSGIHAGLSTNILPNDTNDVAVALNNTSFPNLTSTGGFMSGGVMRNTVIYTNSGSYSFTGAITSGQYLKVTINNLASAGQFVQFRETENQTTGPFYGCNASQWNVSDPLSWPYNVGLQNVGMLADAGDLGRGWIEALNNPIHQISAFVAWFKPGKGFEVRCEVCALSTPVTTRSSACENLPAHAIANTTSTIVQNYVAGSWSPSTIFTYNTTPSTTECRFVCETGYNRNGSACVQNATYSWDTGNWSICSNNQQTRSVVCRDNNGNVVSDNLCTQPKPNTTQTASCSEPQYIIYDIITTVLQVCDGGDYNGGGTDGGGGTVGGCWYDESTTTTYICPRITYQGGLAYAGWASGGYLNSVRLQLQLNNQYDYYGCIIPNSSLQEVNGVYTYNISYLDMEHADDYYIGQLPQGYQLLGGGEVKVYNY